MGEKMQKFPYIYVSNQREKEQSENRTSYKFIRLQ